MLAQANQAQGKADGYETNTPAKPNQGWSLADKIAVFASLAGFLQFLALVATIWIMIRNGRRQLRAYVLTESGNIANVADPLPAIGPRRETDARITHPEWGPVLRIQIKNMGQTPAEEVIHWAAMYFKEWPLTSDLPPIPKLIDAYRSVMGPSIPITKILFWGPRLTEEQVRQLHEGKAALYCQGQITYRDVFRNKHFTTYRLMYSTAGGAIGVNTELTFAEEGNETDDTYKPWWNFGRKPVRPQAQQQTNPEKAN
jgi:hypothetical protein